MKAKTAWFCKECGADSPKWLGRCPACGEWNSLIEEVLPDKTKLAIQIGQKQKKSEPRRISEIESQETIRILTASSEFNRVTGGGIVPGSLILIGGEPGIGKSTLVLQIALRLENMKVLYISGEESDEQIKLRADRIVHKNSECYILAETSLDSIFKHIEKLMPKLVVIDSIQTIFSERLESSAGSVSQIRECTALLLRYAKESGIPIILIGHINKEGSIAGPKILEHIVDTVLQFEGDNNYWYRILRAIKNRFGSTAELGIYEMHNNGLREVKNPSELLLSQGSKGLSGTAVTASMEGVRPFLIEVQALVSSAVYGTPQRSSTGFDLRRLSMLLAVLEKRAGFRLASKDVFLNIAGGIKVNDPAIDLAVVVAVLSSDLDIAIPADICFAAEVGLSGEVRPVNRIEQRITEAKKLGFKKIFISKFNKKGIITENFGIEICAAEKVEDVFRRIFE